MEQNRMCINCGVEIAKDLSNCPLCGKHIGSCEKTNKSYPLYSLKSFQNAKWYNIIRVVFWIAGLSSIIINLVFTTKPFWFPYIIAALVMIFHVFIKPIKNNVSSYIKNLNIMSVLMAIFVIFIDSYNSYAFNITFGWAVAYVAPLIMFAGVLASGVICLTSKIYESELLRRITLQAVISVIYFIVKYFYFKNLTNWPSLVFMCTSLGLVGLLELFKRNKLIKELIKEFHL